MNDVTIPADKVDGFHDAINFALVLMKSEYERGTGSGRGDIWWEMSGKAKNEALHELFQLLGGYERLNGEIK